jgi:hypothetical protein
LPPKISGQKRHELVETRNLSTKRPHDGFFEAAQKVRINFGGTP